MPNQRQVLYKGRCFIARMEAAVLVPYPDGKFYSIGYGHNSPDLKANSPTITFDRAWAMLKEDLIPREKIVNKWLTVPVEQHEFDAFLSGYYQKGSAMRDVAVLINAGKRDDAMSLWMTYNRNKGKFDDGLAERRHHERRLFRKGDYGTTAKPVPQLLLFRGLPGKVKPEYIPFPVEAA